MSDPLSITAGVVGIIAVTLEALRNLGKDVDNIRGAPETIRLLKADVAGLEIVLKSLQSLSEQKDNALAVPLWQKSTPILKDCDQACTSIRSNLQRWTRHSDDGHLVVKDKLSIGLMKQRQIQACCTKLQSAKLSLSLVVQTAALIFLKEDEIPAATQDFAQSVVASQAQTQALIESIPASSNDRAEILKSLKLSQTLLLEIKAQQKHVGDRPTAGPTIQGNVTFGRIGKGFQLVDNTGTMNINF